MRCSKPPMAVEFAGVRGLANSSGLSPATTRVKIRGVLLIGDYFPLLVNVTPAVLTPRSVGEMAKAFDTYFERNERYAVLSVTRRDAPKPGAKERKLVADWVNSPRTMAFAQRLCVGSATVLPGALERGVFTALLWAWKPPFPVKAVANLKLGLDFTLSKLDQASLRLPREESTVRQLVEQRLRDVI